MKKNEDGKNPEKVTEEYFRTFIRTRGSISSLVTAWAGLAIGLLLTIFAGNMKQYQPGTGVTLLFSSLIVIDFYMLCLIGISLSKKGMKWLYQHQFLAEILLTVYFSLFGFLLVILSYFLAAVPNGNLNNLRMHAQSSLVIIFVFLVSIICAIFYNVRWLKKIRTQGILKNRLAKSQKLTSKQNLFWVIFGITFIAGFFTGQTIRWFGFVLGFLFIGAFSRLIVETVYASYLLKQNRQYWIQEAPEKDSRITKTVRTKRNSYALNYLISAVLIVGIAVAKQYFHISAVLNVIFSYLLVLALADIVIVTILVVWRKVKG